MSKHGYQPQPVISKLQTIHVLFVNNKNKAMLSRRFLLKIDMKVSAVFPLVGSILFQADVSPGRRQLARFVSTCRCGCLSWIKCWTVCRFRVTRLNGEKEDRRTHTHTSTHTFRPSGVQWSLDKLIRIGGCVWI